jgi:hypothetical protein
MSAWRFRLPDPRTKYGAVATVVDGIRFHSKREADYWCELRLRERAGDIKYLERQVAMSLDAAGDPATRDRHVCDYLADFVFDEYDRERDDWVMRIEDVKGFEPQVSALKRRFVYAQYGYHVRIVT